MSGQYTAVIVLCWLALAVQCVLVSENNRIKARGKRQFYCVYALIALSALAEWLGILIGESAGTPVWVLRLVKCADYTLTPAAGGAFTLLLGQRNRWSKCMIAVLAANTLFQIAACFSDWMVIVDDRLHYSHGPLYPVYIAVYLLVIVLLIIQFTLYGRSFRRRNRASLFSILALVLIGIAMQEFLGGVRTAYLALTFGAALVFIHFSEFTQLVTDDVVSRQMIEITTDPLTGLQNRNAYSRLLKRYESDGVPPDLAVIMIDLNELKAVNDTLGHEAGDDLIRGAAECIERALGPAYRIGGDEFVFLEPMNRKQADEALVRLQRAASAWNGGQPGTLSLSAGCALAEEHPGLTIDALVKEADRAMYEAKSRYYRENGLDRRRR